MTRLPMEFDNFSPKENFSIENIAQDAIREATLIIHVAKFGEKKLPDNLPESFRELVGHGCPCYQCFRDDFL